jgi:two-component system, cell cycle sensor histidine kinase and response regulator CckA
MTIPPSANGTVNNKNSIPLLLALIAAGLAGNYFGFPIFLNIDFLFGSIFAMLALQFLGLGRGILAAAIIASSTYFIWNHPYTIIIMTAEVALVGWLMGRRKMGMVLADTLYWLVIGMPLAYLFYRLVMQVPFSNTYIVMTKQAVNGIANALVARLIFTCYALRSRSSLMSYSEIICDLLAFFVLCPSLILLALHSRTDFAEADRAIRTLLMQDSRLVDHRLETWVTDRKSATVNLAEMAASRSPQQMQSCLEQAKKSDANFLRIGLLDREGISTAFYPLLDELGQKNIGKNYADRPFIPRLKQTLKPMLSEAVMGKIGIPKPVVLMLAPVVIQGEYGGYVAGTLSLNQLQVYLDMGSRQNAIRYSLLDKNGNVIMSNRPDQKVMTPFVRGKGTLNHLNNGISQWLPVLPHNTPFSERWRQSFYVAESTIGDLAEWRLILEQPVAPFQKALFDAYTGKLILLFLILLLSLALAELLSRRIMVAIERLRQITCDLPSRLASGANIKWPESGIQESNALINNFQEMSTSIQQHVVDLKLLNESLEQRVEERTQQLEQLANENRIILNIMPVGLCILRDRKVVMANPAFDKILGYEAGETSGMDTAVFYAGIEAYNSLGKDGYSAIAGDEIYAADLELTKKDGSLIWCSMVGQVINVHKPEDGVIWMIQDITVRKRSEEALRESERKYHQLNETLEQRIKEAVDELRDKDRMLLIQGRQAVMGEMIGNISHQWRQPLNMLGLLAQELPMTYSRGEFNAEYLNDNVSKTKEIIQHMSKTIDDFRSFFEPGKEKVEFRLLEVIEEAMSFLEGSFEAHKIATELKPTGDPSIIGYPNEFAQVLMNIVNNARDALVARKVENPTITISLWTEDGKTVVTISDNAGGIPEGIIDKVFEPYFTTKGPDKGTGIGLYMSKNIIDQHMGGSLSVRNVEGGAEFRIEV